MKRILSSLIVLSAAWLIVGCTVQGPDRGQSFAERVAPTAQVTLGEEKAIDIAMGFVNESNRRIPQQDEFAGQWVLAFQVFTTARVAANFINTSSKQLTLHDHGILRFAVWHFRFE
jgi:hypothetical protein